MSNPASRVMPLVWLLLFALSVLGFYEASLAYEAFRILDGIGVNKVHHSELTFSLWFLLFGLAGAVALTHALRSSPVPVGLERGVRWLASRPCLAVTTLAVGGLGVILLLRHTVLQCAPVADDESTYVFIARTLLHGRVINPLPGDNAFFANQFIVFNSEGWYGKYPIGHPLMLAAGEAVGLRVLVVPLLSFGSLIMTYVVGRRLFGELQACLALGLLALSPQFLFTSATELSQPTETLFMLLGLGATVRLAETDRWPWALLAGGAWAYGVLVRPLPGGLFLLAAGLWYLVARSERPWGEHLRKRVPLAVVALVPVVACAAVMIWVNGQQTGSALKTGYHVAHERLDLFANAKGQISLSAAAALLRQSFWLFGWPLSFVFVPFGRSRRALGLLWGLIAAEYFYRVLVPKTVVATTGPIYVMEIVPLLALLTADGLIRAKRWLEAHKVGDAKAWVVSFALASTIVGYTLFVPVRARVIYRGAEARNEVYRALERQGASKRALVFSQYLVPFGVSWAYFPPPPSPALDDDVVFVRFPRNQMGFVRCIDFWMRRFPGHTAWSFEPGRGLQRMAPNPTQGPEGPR